MKAKTSKYLHSAKDTFFITVGIALYVVAFVCFQLPYHFTTGGVTGIAAVVFYATGVPVQYTFLAINVVLLAIALKVLGVKFMINTIYAVLMMSALMVVVQDLIREPNGSFPLILGDQEFMSCVVGAAFEGIGLGIVFLNNGSTGGTDIIAAMVNKYRDISLGQMMVFLDLLIISSSYLIFHSVQLLIYGYCIMIIVAFTMDGMMQAVRQSVQFMIFSSKYDEIATAISQSGRGATILNGEGWYTKQERKVLVVLCRRRESTYIFRIIRKIDPRAFVSQAKVSGVFGEGFDEMKGSK